MNEYQLIFKLRAAHPDNDTTGFNCFDFIHAFGSGREALLYARLFWPEFVEFKNMVFLQQTIESEDDKRQIERAFEHYGNNPLKTEQSFNVVEIPSLFGRRIGETDDDEDRLLAGIIAETWAGRLRNLFPDRHFDVKVLEAKETEGEVSVLFFQSKT